MPAPEGTDDDPRAALASRVRDGTADVPLLTWLCERFTYRTAAEWRASIALGHVTCNGVAARHDAVLRARDLITVTAAPDDPRPVTILWQDERCLVVDKRAGHVVHAASVHSERTFLRNLAAHVGVDALHCVHRLDRDTSGALLLAKDAAAMTALQRQFANGAVRKDYLALTHGVWPEDHVVVDAAIGQRPGGAHARRTVVAAGAAGARTAVTEFAVMLRLRANTLVHARPRTGRTHQIRVHLEHLGRALVGDKLYGTGDAAGSAHHLLHAAALTFCPPANPELQVTVRAALPAHFASTLAACR